MILGLLFYNIYIFLGEFGLISSFSSTFCFIHGNGLRARI